MPDSKEKLNERISRAVVLETYVEENRQEQRNIYRISLFDWKVQIMKGRRVFHSTLGKNPSSNGRVNVWKIEVDIEQQKNAYLFSS